MKLLLAIIVWVGLCCVVGRCCSIKRIRRERIQKRLRELNRICHDERDEA